MKNPFEDEMDYEQENKNNMVYWYPLLKTIKIPTPKTILVDTGDCDLSPLLDGEVPTNYYTYLQRVKTAIHEISLPCFLRTGNTSDKHSWKDTCYIEKDDDKYLSSHIRRLVEFSYMANIAGLPLDYSIWAVRELIKTKPLFHAFNDMPIAKERRLFINKGELICNHPYWPEEAFENHATDYKKYISELHYLTKEDEENLKRMAEFVSRFFKGYWSIDFLQDINNKWWLTDMAVGERSYHWSECKHNLGKS